MDSPAQADPSQELSPSAKLAKSLFETGTAAFDPSSKRSPSETREARAEFHRIIDSAGTWTLVQALNGLLKPDAVPAWLRKEVMGALVRLPLRPLGVRATLEFVFSVHPSGAMSAADQTKPEKKGANIAPEALAMATQLLSSVPPGVSDQIWVDALEPQLLHLLDSKEGNELAHVAGYVVSFGFLGRRRLGAPGTPGWDAFVNPILRKIRPSLDPDWLETLDRDHCEEVIDLSRDRVVSSAGDLQRCLARLSVLLNASPSPSLCQRIVDPILLELWAISSWSAAPSPLQVNCCNVAASILRTFLKVTSGPEKAEKLIRNALYIGEVDDGHIAWKYQVYGQDVLQVVIPRHLERSPRVQDLNWSEVEYKTSQLAKLLTEGCTDRELSTLFLQLFRKWVSTKTDPAETVKTKAAAEIRDPVGGLLEMMVLQQLMEVATGKLISRADQLLDVTAEVMEADRRESLGPQILSVALSILNHVISAPGFRKSSVKPGVLELIDGSLERLMRAEAAPVAQTANNLRVLLRHRDDIDEAEGATPASDKQVEDRSTYKLAISYITDSESPPPVKAEGLNLISGLIHENSPALDIPAVLVLLSRLLTDSEDFVNLRVIRIFVELANKHPKTVCQEILDHYLDPKEFATTDTRLRFGEALIQVVEHLGEMFTGDVATQVFEVLLSIASRRGRRPKTERRQQREARQAEKDNKEAAEAWGGEVPDMSDDVTEQEKLDNEILSRIVEGWESKRGSEDVRMRASALSILSSAVETNISDIGPSLTSTGVDLCISVLALEPEVEKGILRRAAIIYILGFARALDSARREGRRLGFGLTDESREDILRTLRYIAATDNDGMVQQHAKDVIESLENLQASNLLHQSRFEGAGASMESIVRLSERLDIQGTISPNRPRIEELE